MQEKKKKETREGQTTEDVKVKGHVKDLEDNMSVKGR